MSEKLDLLTKDIEQSEKEKLKSVFPECFAEEKLDIDKLLNLCGEYIDKDFEKYRFEWKGKADALKKAHMRTNATLRPCEEESINWKKSQNLYIEGDNLEVLKLLQTSYYGKVKMIYIDPPYNTGNDFVYKDTFADTVENYKKITLQRTKSNPETTGRHHTNWLNMMYPRLRLAKNLLKQEGVIFISIDDNEVHNLRKLCEEVFGEDNFVACISILSNPRGRQSSSLIAQTHENILVYAKNINNCEFYGLNLEQKDIKQYNKRDEVGLYREIGLRKRGSDAKAEDSPTLCFPLYYNIKENDFYLDKKNKDDYVIMPMLSDNTLGRWRWSKEKIIKDKNLLLVRKVNDRYDIFQKDYLTQNKSIKVKSLWHEKEINYDRSSEELRSIFNNRLFDYAKPLYLVSKILKIATSSNDLILDFFSGSATTAHAVMQLNAEDGGHRRFIMVQLPELCKEKSEAYKMGYKNICEIGKERIRRAGKKILKENQQIKIEGKEALDIGFKVFKLDSSNLKTWNNTPIKNDTNELIKRLKMMLETIKQDRREIDIVYEIMLKLGEELTEEITQLELEGKTMHAVGDDYRIMICLAKNVNVGTAKAILDYAPRCIIFAEHCFNNTTDKTNVRLLLDKHSITIKTL